MKKIFLSTTILLLGFVFSCSNDDDDTTNQVNTSLNNVGALANGFLSDNTFNSLTVEIAHEPNAKPSTAAVDSLKSFLQARLNKQSINFIYTPIPAQNKAVFSIEEIREIKSTYRTVNNSGSNITAFFFFADGNYNQDTENSKTLGVAFNASSMAIFQKTIDENTGGFAQPSKSSVEEGVLKHEFCHILGLVNLGSAMQSNHEDNDHPKHCTVSSCLMYHTVESGDFFANLMGGNMPTLDSQCIADLRANGGK